MSCSSRPDCMFFETRTSGDKCILRNACDEIADTNVELYQRNDGFLACTGLTAAAVEMNVLLEVGFEST